MIVRYVSNLKWLLLSIMPLVRKAQNWPTVLVYYVIPRSSPLLLKMRNGDRFLIPYWYVYEAIAETLLMDAYRFSPETNNVTVDIGASIGDFSILASGRPGQTVYAFEPNPEAFKFMKANIGLNGRDKIRVEESAADEMVLTRVLAELGDDHIDFLKMDCEGCEYNVLLKCSESELSRVDKIAMEIHHSDTCSEEDIIARLRRSGFDVTQERRLGQGRYVFASRS